MKDALRVHVRNWGAIGGGSKVPEVDAADVETPLLVALTMLVGYKSLIVSLPYPCCLAFTRAGGPGAPPSHRQADGRVRPGAASVQRAVPRRDRRGRSDYLYH